MAEDQGPSRALATQHGHPPGPDATPTVGSIALAGQWLPQAPAQANSPAATCTATFSPWIESIPAADMPGAQTQLRAAMLTIPGRPGSRISAIRQASIPGRGLSFTALPSVCLETHRAGAPVASAARQGLPGRRSPATLADGPA